LSPRHDFPNVVVRRAPQAQRTTPTAMRAMH
jgi:hypothetical protein